MTQFFKTSLLVFGPVLPLLLGFTAWRVLSSSKSSKIIYSESGYDITPLSQKELKHLYNYIPKHVLNIATKSQTEKPFSSPLYIHNEDGVYVSAITNLPLFDSQTKYDSNSGWPSFYKPFDKQHIIELPDYSHGMQRTEVIDAKSGTHLGHVFNDGPPPTRKRYCINGLALKFIKRQEFLDNYQPAIIPNQNIKQDL